LLLLALVACGKAGSGTAAAGSPLKKDPGHATSSPAGPPVGIELRRGRQPRELVRIGMRGVMIGPESGPLVWKLPAEPSRADDAWYFLRVYAPFVMKSAEGDLTFRGHGKVNPGPAERRMILEWARQVATEVAGGRGGTAYGLVLAWHQGGPGGVCEDVVLDLSGEAVATACGWDREVRGRLDPEPLGRVYDWFDRLQPFQTAAEGQEEGPGAGELQARLIFVGRGSKPTSPATQEEIQSFAASLFAELAARRRGSLPVPADAAPLPRLLLPPGAGGGRGEILLQLPENPPPVPKPSLPQPPLSRPLPSPLTGREGALNAE